MNYSPGFDDGVPDGRTLTYLNPFKEDTSLDMCSLADHAPFAYRGAAADGGASPHLALLRHKDRWQQGNIFGNLDGLGNASVPELVVASDRSGEDVL